MPTWSLLPWVKPNTPLVYSYIVYMRTPYSVTDSSLIYSFLGSSNLIRNEINYNLYSKEDFECLPAKNHLQIRNRTSRMVFRISLGVEELKTLMRTDKEAIENYIISYREDIFDRNNRQWEIGVDHQILEPYCCTVS